MYSQKDFSGAIFLINIRIENVGAHALKFFIMVIKKFGRPANINNPVRMSNIQKIIVEMMKNFVIKRLLNVFTTSFGNIVEFSYIISQ